MLLRKLVLTLVVLALVVAAWHHVAPRELLLLRLLLLHHCVQVALSLASRVLTHLLSSRHADNLPARLLHQHHLHLLSVVNHPLCASRHRVLHLDRRHACGHASVPAEQQLHLVLRAAHVASHRHSANASSARFLRLQDSHAAALQLLRELLRGHLVDPASAASGSTEHCSHLLLRCWLRTMLRLRLLPHHAVGVLLLVARSVVHSLHLLSLHLRLLRALWFDLLHLLLRVLGLLRDRRLLVASGLCISPDVLPHHVELLLVSDRSTCNALRLSLHLGLLLNLRLLLHDHRLLLWLSANALRLLLHHCLRILRLHALLVQALLL